MTQNVEIFLLVQFLLCVVGGEIHQSKVKVGEAVVMLQPVFTLASGCEKTAAYSAPGNNGFAINFSRSSRNKSLCNWLDSLQIWTFDLGVYHLKVTVQSIFLAGDSAQRLHETTILEGEIPFVFVSVRYLKQILGIRVIFAVCGVAKNGYDVEEMHRKVQWTFGA